jgi:integrase
MASVRKRTWKSRGIERSSWIVDYFDQVGTRRQKTFSTKKEADAWSVSALHEVKLGIHTAASASVTVCRAGELWIEECEAEGLERSTVRQRRQHLDLHINPFIGKVRLSELSMPSVNEFVALLRREGRSLPMRRKILTSLKTMLSFAQGRGLVAQNAATGAKVKNDDRSEKGPLREAVDYPSRAQVKTLMDAANARWRPLLIVAMFTGMRASELRGLPWSDVDLDQGVIHVRQRADAWGNIGKPKSKAGKRDIPLPPIVINTLKEWRAICPPSSLDLVFGNGRGNVESIQNIYKRFWVPVQEKCGLPHYGFHALRHVAASLFIAYLGWTPKRVQVVMGHSSITVTFDLYGHLFEDKAADREAMEKLEAAIVAA